MPIPRALVTGIMGQDGAYLAQSLLNDGYEVFGTTRTSSVNTNWRLEKLGISDNPRLKLVDVDITDYGSVRSAVQEIKPNEIFNLASHSFVANSFIHPLETTSVTGTAVVNILQAIRDLSPETKFFQAGSSEMFGNALSYPQNENSHMNPRNIYGSAKVFAHLASVNYRESGGLFSSSGILFNHESPLRGSEFVTRKITRTVAEIKLGKTDRLRLGNLSSLRDWGFAPEYVEGMRLILGHRVPDTFVLSSGVLTSVRDLVEAAFNALEIDIAFEGSGMQEIGYSRSNGKVLVSVEEEFFRETEKVPLVGDSTKARELLGWQGKTKITSIALKMVEEDLASLSEGLN